MLSSNYRFIESAFTPVISPGGWAVPKPYTQRFNNGLVSNDMIKDALSNILVEGEDYRIQYYDNEIKRIIFNTDEAFVMAKMIL